MASLTKAARESEISWFASQVMGSGRLMRALLRFVENRMEACGGRFGALARPFPQSIIASTNFKAGMRR